jgi:predicted  nucleic acid-binding Zn-ribbon protein
MTIYKRYKELGISNKEVFTDEEFAAMPDISTLYPLWKEYNSLTSQKASVENRLAVAQARNADLPDNSARIAELQTYIDAIDGATTLEQIQLRDTRAEYVNEKEQLEAEQTAIDTTPIQAEIDSLASQITAKETEINNECTVLGIEGILNG